MYKSAEIVEDSDKEADSLALSPPPPRPGPRKCLVPEVAITTVPRKRISPPLTREAEGRRGVEKDGVNGSPKGKKRQKKAVDEAHFDGVDDEAEASLKKRPKAPPKGRGKGKVQPKEVVDDEDLEEEPAEYTAKASKKTKAKTKAARKKKPVRSGKPRVVDLDDEATRDAAVKDSEVVLEDSEQAGGSPMAQPNTGGKKTQPPRDATINSTLIGAETVSSRNSQYNQENPPQPPTPVKSKPNQTVTPSPASRRIPAPTSASSFARLNYGHSIANDEKPITMAEIIRKVTSETGTPSRIKSHSSFAKGSRSVLRKIAPLHARRRTPPPLPPKPPQPKKSKKQLELEEKWEEELEDTIEGWAALSSQERELLRRQKRDMEMGYED
jgi:hypothetical protein